MMHCQWELKKLDNWDFVNGAHTANIGQKVFAVLLEKPEATEWKFEPVFHQGDTYTLVFCIMKARTAYPIFLTALLERRSLTIGEPCRMKT